MALPRRDVSAVREGVVDRAGDRCAVRARAGALEPSRAARARRRGVWCCAALGFLVNSAVAPEAFAQVFAQSQDPPFAASISPPPTGDVRAQRSEGGLAGAPFTLVLGGGGGILPYERVSFAARGVPRDSFAPYAPRAFEFNGAALGVRAPAVWRTGLVAQVFPVRPYMLGGSAFIGLGGAGGDAAPGDPEALRIAQNQSVRFYDAALGPSLQLSTGPVTLRATFFVGLRASELVFAGLYDESRCTSAGCTAGSPSPTAWALRPLLQARAFVDVRVARISSGVSLVLGASVAGEVLDGTGVLLEGYAGLRTEPRAPLPSPP